MLRTMKMLKVLVALIFLVSCELTGPDENLMNEGEGTIRLEYRGLEWAEGGFMPSFSLVNDSTETIQYFGYGVSYPLYNAEALADTGWTDLMWGWCGTGAEFYPLEPDSSIQFLGMLPSYSCTWRLVLYITEMDSVSSRILRSENIIYTLPKN
ncbi:MAG: hypothetical protein HQ556_16210 [Candidatus Marinimicrobia bacterium]|nr:hypothetical protein [Candidatus Neomarinimicrobiota bacterium]